MTRRLTRRRLVPLVSILALAGMVALVIAVVPSWFGGSAGDPGAGPSPSPSGSGAQVAARIGSAVLLRSSTDPAAVARQDPALVADAETDLGLAVLRHARPGATVSPASLAVALAMLEHGARGTTADQIAAVLGTPGLSAEQRSAAWHTLRAEWADAARRAGITLESANSLWEQDRFAVAPAFLSALARYYDTGVWQVDFAHDLPAAIAAMNQWTAEHTHGRITRMFDPGTLDDSTRLVLADAMYLQAPWAQPFDASDTAAGQLHPCRRQQHHRLVHARRPGGALCRSRRQYRAAELPYRGGRFTALVIMPTSGSLSSFTHSLSAAELHRIAGGLHSAPVALALPRFTTSSVLDLNSTLAALGMPAAFTDRRGPLRHRTATCSCRRSCSAPTCRSARRAPRRPR